MNKEMIQEEDDDGNNIEAIGELVLRFKQERRSEDFEQLLQELEENIAVASRQCRKILWPCSKMEIQNWLFFWIVNTESFPAHAEHAGRKTVERLKFCLKDIELELKREQERNKNPNNKNPYLVDVPAEKTILVANEPPLARTKTEANAADDFLRRNYLSHQENIMRTVKDDHLDLLGIQITRSEIFSILEIEDRRILSAFINHEVPREKEGGIAAAARRLSMHRDTYKRNIERIKRKIRDWTLSNHPNLNKEYLLKE